VEALFEGAKRPFWKGWRVSRLTLDAVVVREMAKASSRKANRAMFVGMDH
jgi:hypothetical protein